MTIDSNLDCGTSSSQCGSEYWFLTNGLYRKFFLGKCQNGKDFSTHDKVFCDTPTNMSPCKSATKDPISQTAIVDCSSQGLADDTLAGLIAIIKSSALKVDTLLLNSNNLQRIPTGLDQFPHLVNLNLASNSITAVGATDISGLTGAVELIDLSRNQIASIAAAAFPGDTKAYIVI